MRTEATELVDSRRATVAADAPAERMVRGGGGGGGPVTVTCRTPGAAAPLALAVAASARVGDTVAPLARVYTTTERAECTAVTAASDGAKDEPTRWPKPLLLVLLVPPFVAARSRRRWKRAVSCASSSPPSSSSPLEPDDGDTCVPRAGSCDWATLAPPASSAAGVARNEPYPGVGEPSGVLATLDGDSKLWSLGDPGDAGVSAATPMSGSCLIYTQPGFR